MQTEQASSIVGGQLFSSGPCLSSADASAEFVNKQLSGPNPQTRDQECQQISANLRENIQFNYQNTTMGITWFFKTNQEINLSRLKS